MTQSRWVHHDDAHPTQRVRLPESDALQGRLGSPVPEWGSLQDSLGRVANGKPRRDL